MSSPKRLRAQHGVTELAHVAQRRFAPRARLGVELGERRRVLLALDLHVGCIGHRPVRALVLLGRPLVLLVLQPRCLLVAHDA